MVCTHRHVRAAVVERPRRQPYRTFKIFQLDYVKDFFRDDQRIHIINICVLIKNNRSVVENKTTRRRRVLRHCTGINKHDSGTLFAKIAGLNVLCFRWHGEEEFRSAPHNQNIIIITVIFVLCYSLYFESF